MKNIILNFLNDFKKNYKTLILAFVIAVGFWMVVSIQVFPTLEDKIKDIGIEALLTDYMIQNNLQITSEIEETASITIEGKRYDISDLKASDFYANIDLSSVRSSGTYTLPITVSSKTDRDYTLIDTEPRAVTVTIDEIITKEFDLEATAPDIRLPDGFYSGADEITASPGRISITGSANVLNSITRIEARSTYHGEISEARQTNSELYIYGANGTRILPDGLELSTENISINILIYKQKELPLTFSIINYPANFDIDSLKYEIQPSALIVAAPDDSIDNLSELNIGTVDIADIEPNKTSFIPIVLPEGYKNLSGNNNARIVWDIESYAKLDFTVDKENFTITNAPDNFDVRLVTNEIKVTAVGPMENISNLTSSDFNVTVNLLGVNLREGTQDVSAFVSIKGAGQKSWVYGEYKVNVNAVTKGS